jgi:hypothetical protein
VDTPCPSCGQPFAPGAPACPACGIRLVGPDAQRLWQVDQHIAALTAERRALLAGLRTPAGAPAVGSLESQPGQRATHGPARPVRRERSWTVQQLLLTGGVVLLLVAAVVFIAVAWERIGITGQVAVLGILTATGVTGARLLSRRNLHASAEAVALLTCGLAVVDAVGVRRYGLFGTDALSEATFWLIGLPFVAAVAVVGALSVRRSETFPIAAVLATAAWPGALAAAVEADVSGIALIAAGTWAAGVAACLLAATRARFAVVVALAACAGGWLLLGAQSALVATGADSPWDGGALALLAVVVLLAGLLVVARTAAVPRQLRTASLAVAYVLGVGVVVTEANYGGAGALAAVSVAASAALAAVVVLGLGRRWRGLVPALVGLTWLSGLVSASRPDASWAVAGVWLAAACAAGAVVSRRTHGTGRTGLTAYSAATGAAAVGAFAHGGSDLVRVVAMSVLVAGLAVAAALRRDHREELGLAAGAVAAGLVGAGYALASTDRPLVLLAVVLGTAGVAALAYGALPHRGLAAVGGVLLCTGSTWSLALDADVHVVEVYSLPLAALALAAGLVRRSRKPGAPSWTTVGPGLTAGLMPSAFASVPDAALTRPLLTLLAGVVVTAVGVRLREQAPVVTGVLASVVVAIAQIGPYAVALPRWVSLGLAGAVLLAMGFRYEQRRREALAAAHWFGALR